MQPMFVAATAGILVSMTLALARAILGPTVYDRVMAVNTFGTKTGRRKNDARKFSSDSRRAETGAE